MVFLPSAMTSAGMSSYFMFTINSETYLVSPGAWGSSAAAGAAAKAESTASVAVAPLRSVHPARASDVLQKSRRIIGRHLACSYPPVLTTAAILLICFSREPAPAVRLLKSQTIAGHGDYSAWEHSRCQLLS